jgi:hypothetical protein
VIYIILGMHKSGTTLVSQILHHSGIYMGDGIDENVSYDRGNKYECASVHVLNSEILDAEPFGPGFSSIDLPAPGALRVTEGVRSRIREFVQERGAAYDNWGFKDPRTCLTYPVWASELPEHRIITIYRPLPEIWPRYRYHSLHRSYRNPRRAWRLVNRWCEHNTNILTHLQKAKVASLVLNYQELMTTQTEFDRLQEFIGFELEDQRKPSLYRGRSQSSPLLRITIGLVQKRTGCNPGKIIAQLDALRK